MLLGIIRFFRGWVTFRVTGRFPERFINVALKSGMGIFGVTPYAGGLYASALLSDYKHVRPVARKAGVRLKVIHRYGCPFILHKYKSRWGIAAGVALFVVLTLFLKSFVWTVDINGIENLSRSDVITALEESGVYVGAFKPTLDTHKAERKLELQFEEIGWMSVNLAGTHAEVEIKEKTKVPELEYSDTVSNIKASRDGIILSTNVRRGTAEVKAGSAVSQGQILVSGMYKNSLEEIHFVDADAEILAETFYDFTSSCDEAFDAYVPQNIRTRSSLSFLGVNIPVTFCPEENPYTSFVTKKQLCLAGTEVPVTLSTQYMIPFRLQGVFMDSQKAEKKLNNDLALYKLFVLKDVEEISCTSQITKTQRGYTLSARLVCKEDIALKENMIVNP